MPDPNDPPPPQQPPPPPPPAYGPPTGSTPPPGYPQHAYPPHYGPPGYGRNPQNEDAKHLKALSIAYIVFGSIGVVAACLPLLHVTIGILALTGNLDNADNGPPPAEFGWIFVIVGGLFFLIGQVLAICTILSGRYLGQRRRYIFSFVMACVLCTAFPIGTVLGILTILVLCRDSVKQLYGRAT